ncbi:MAG: FtsX-like permease family protein [Bacteroidota bacterium]
MLRNYFKAALRNITRNKAFSFINIIGLSIGISAALVIFLIVQYDFSFDTFHRSGKQMYRVVSVLDFSGTTIKNGGVPFPLSNAMRKEATGMNLVTPFTRWEENQKIEVAAHDGAAKLVVKKYDRPVFADADYFKMIPYQWIAGSASTSLQDPYKVVLTQKAVQLFFPKLSIEQVVGKQLVFDDTIRATVSGVVADLKENSDFIFTTFVSRATQERTSLKPKDWEEWNNTTDNSQLFVELSPGTSVAHVEKQANDLLKKYQKKEAGDKSTQKFQLQPLSDLHFNSDFGGLGHRIAHKPTLYGLLAVAVFLLLLGCINFINLTTAQASQRAKEIVIRKTMGSSKKQLIFQFLSETFFITLLATVVSIVLTPVLLKIFSDFIPPELHFNLLEQPLMILFLVALLLVVSFLSGFYPALILSAYKPVNVLKNQSNLGAGKTRSAWVRKSLTVSQFIIAQVFILATLVVSKQIHYTLSKDLGFKKDAIIYFTVNYRDTVKAHKAILLSKIRAVPEVALVGLSTGTPTSTNNWSSTIKYKNGKKEIDAAVDVKFADTGYIKQFSLKLLAGNNFEKSDSGTQFLINETYARFLGFTNPQDAVGKYIEWSRKQVPIVGVLADFHQQSLHDKIKPLAIGNWGSILRVFSMNLQPRTTDGNNWKAGIEKIETAWKSIYPEEDFDYSFLDDTIAKYYKSEQNISSLLKWATGLAIFISCLGLLGLVMYTTNLRTKEIGVRKVLGASISHIISLLSKEFLLLVLIAFLVAEPVAWWAMHKWMESFAYRASINLWLFIGAGFFTIIIALVTISFQTFKAASANPVKSLRTE